MNSKIIEKPITSNRKVYIINNSEKMTVDAQNCLLKTLEEPPKYASIILICSNETQMLTTIKSRCTKILFQDIKKEELKEYFENALKEQISDNLLELAQGSIGKAIQVKEKEELYKNIENILNNIETIKKSQIWTSTEILYKCTDEIFEILDYLNIMFFYRGKNDIRYLNCIEIVENTKKRIKSNSNYNMTIDRLLLHIWEEINEKYSRGEI